jgi:hypothetical protein
MCVLTCWECRFEMLPPVNVCVVAQTKCYSSVFVVFMLMLRSRGVYEWGGGGLCMWVYFD